MEVWEHGSVEESENEALKNGMTGRRDKKTSNVKPQTSNYKLQTANCKLQTDFNPWLHRFAVLTAIATVFLIAVGASVTSKGAGDAVPDWPLSYGRLNPPMVGGIFYEHSHRLVAGAVALMITILMAWLWRWEPRRWVRHLGTLAFIAVIAQAVLGGLRVLVISDNTVQQAALRLTGVGHVYPVRVGIGVIHATLAQIVLCLTFAIALFTSRAWLRAAGHGVGEWESGRMGGEPSPLTPHPSPPHPLTTPPLHPLTTPHRLGLFIVLAVFVQLLLGAVMRQSGAGLIIPDFPLSFGHLIPPFNHLPYDPNAPFPMTYSEYVFKVAVHFAHRTWAYVIALLIIANFVLLYRAGGMRLGPLYRLSLLTVGLVVVQVLLGALILWTHQTEIPYPVVGQSAVSATGNLTQWISIVHVMTGATLLGLCVLYTLWCRAVLLAPRQVIVSVPQKEVPA